MRSFLKEVPIFVTNLDKFLNNINNKVKKHLTRCLNFLA